jgi:TolB-like protein/Tfp pilus assembly protein PilF
MRLPHRPNLTFLLAIALLGGLFAHIPKAQAKGPKTTVAVFPFKVLNPGARYKHLGEGASDALVNHIVRSGALRIVEESQLNKAIESIARSNTGYFEEESMLQVGRLVHARFIVIGSVDVLEDQVAINGRVLEVETAQLLVAERVHGPLKNAFSLYDKLAIPLTKQLLKNLSMRVSTEAGDDADAVAVRQILNTAKKYDPAFGGEDLSRAISLYRSAVLRSPDMALPRFALGRALVLDKNFHEAHYNLKKAVEYDPKHALAWAFLGYAKDKLGDPNEGRDHYKKAIRLKPKLSLAHFWLAANLFNAGKYGEARVHAQKAKVLGDPRGADLLRNIDAARASKKKR